MDMHMMPGTEYCTCQLLHDKMGIACCMLSSLPPAQAVAPTAPASAARAAPIERLQHLRGRQVELIQHNPVALPHRLHQQPFPEHQPPALIAHIAAQILLQAEITKMLSMHSTAGSTFAKCEERQAFRLRRLS
jgi:hypothetical protein